MNMQEIGRRISAMRKEKDMTQLELADKIGVSYQAVSSWERGLTMPDISKLPDISQVLAVSIDELLGSNKQAEVVRNVLNNRTDVYSESPIEIDDLIEVAPIMKPRQMNELAGSAKSKKLSELVGLAPFIDSEVLYSMALNAEVAGDLDGIVSIAPFLKRGHIDELAMKIESVEGIGALVGLAPFISKNTLGELAKKTVAAGSIDELTSIAPFLDRQLLGQLVMGMLDSKDAAGSAAN